MRAKSRNAVCSLALSLLLALPSVALGQQSAAGELLREINDALASNPSVYGTYQLRLGPNGLLVADIADENGVVSRWEMYAEDVVSVTHTRSGQAYLNCDGDLGRCARQTCDGAFTNFEGCVRTRSGASRPRYSDALELQYGYDTRVLKVLDAAFDELLSLNLGS
ncbi:MAG: hypothetical protein MJB57_01235 [Gemmatimonadetes bacterium]|nr:hypothetical protein [Gemmatimonadota bacterium]